MVGKARIFSDGAREAVFQKEFDDEIYTTASQQNSYNLGSVHFSDNSGIANITQAGTDQRKANLKGALYTGNIGFDLQTSVLDVGTNTIDLLEDATGAALSVVSTDRFVTLSAGTTADLVTILGSQRPGQRLTLYNTLTNTITIKHTAAATQDTIRTPNGLDFVFLGNMAVNLVFDITSAQWRIIGGAVGSGTTGYDTIEDEGIAVTQRTTMNFIGVGVTAVDNPGTATTDITISTSGYTTIEDEGTPLTQRTTFNFIGAGVTAVDNAGTSTTDITIPGGGGGSQTPWLQDIDADGFDLTDLSNIQFRQTTGSPSPNAYAIFREPGFLIFNVPTAADYKFRVQGSDEYTFNSTEADFLSNSIKNVNFITSDTANRTTSGFVQMAAVDLVQWRNTLDSDDLFINAQRPTLGVTTQDAVAFTVASGVRMYVGQFDISVESNDIINTGDVLPQGTGGEVGDATNFYNQMHSQFFIPEGAAVILGRFGLAKTGNTLYVNYDDTNVDAGFSVYEQGFESFRFYNPTSTTNEIHIGSSSVFTAGETYRVQMGENSNSSGTIEFTEGTGNDVIINRGGAGPDQGVQIRGSGLSLVRFLSNSIKIFQPFDANTKDLFNVVDVKSNGGGGATTGTIGELITNDGGFNYFMRDTLAWESNEDTKLTFSSGGITLETNGTNTDIDISVIGISSDIDLLATGTITQSVGTTFIQVASNVITFDGGNFFLTNGTEYIGFLDAASGGSLASPAAGDINLFNNLDTGELSVKKPGGTVVSLEGGGANTLNDLTDVTISSASAGEFLRFNGSLWVNSTIQSGDLPTTISGTHTFSGAITMTSGLDMSDGIISDVNQIGFSVLGNFIEDDTSGMRYITVPGDQHLFGDGTNIFATLDVDGLFLNQLFVQFTSITSPGPTGSTNVGELFMNSGNNDHLSIIRNGGVIDLEAGGGETNTASNVGTGTGKVFKQKVGVNFEFKSILGGANIIITNGTDDVQITSTSDGNQDATPFVDPTSGNPLVGTDVYMSNSKQGLEISNTTNAQEDIMVYVPIFLGRTTNIDRLAWVKADNVSVGSISWTIGIYDSVNVSPNVGANYPGDLLVSGNTTSDSTEGIKFIGISPTTFAPGLYWLGFLITNISTASTLVTSARHETANANCVGYFINSAANDRLDNILSFAEAETSVPSSAPADMAIIGANPMALFYRVNSVS